MRQLGDTKFYSVKEIAKAFNLTEPTVREYFRTGKIKAQKFGVSWYTTEQAVKDYFEKGGDGDDPKQ